MGQALLVDFCNQNNPRAHTARSSEPRSFAAGSKPACADRFPNGICGWHRFLSEATPAEVSRARGRVSSRRPGVFRHDCSWRKLRPNPIGSDTSCRGLVATPAGKAGEAERSSKDECWLRVHLTSLLARSSRPARPLTRSWLGLGPPHASLREEERDPPHPRCLPSMSHPRGVWPLSTGCE